MNNRMQNPRRSPRQVNFARPRRRRQRRKFRWYILIIPSLLLVAAWVSKGIRPAIEWGAVMDLLNVRDRKAYTQMAMLGVLLCAGLIVFRILRKKEDES